MRVYGAMVDDSVHGVVDRATDSDAFEYAARAGFAVSGVLHIVIGYLIAPVSYTHLTLPTNREV